MLKTVDILGTSVKLYDLLNRLGAVCMLVFLILRRDRLRSMSLFTSGTRIQIKPARAAVGTLIRLVVLMLLFLGLLLTVNPAFGKWFTAGNANYYGTLVAWVLAASVCSVLYLCPPGRFFDLCSPGLPLFLAVSKLACFFDGCCSGFAAETFYFNHETNRREFPVQLAESGVALALFILLLIYERKNKRVGTVFPVYVTAYSVSRFLTEFLRDDFPNVLGPLDAYQLMSIVFFALGLAGYFAVRKKGAVIDAFAAAKYDDFYDGYFVKKKAGKSRTRSHGQKRRR